MLLKLKIDKSLVYWLLCALCMLIKQVFIQFNKYSVFLGKGLSMKLTCIPFFWLFVRSMASYSKETVWYYVTMQEAVIIKCVQFYSKRLNTIIIKKSDNTSSLQVQIYWIFFGCNYHISIIEKKVQGTSIYISFIGCLIV